MDPVLSELSLAVEGEKRRNIAYHGDRSLAFGASGSHSVIQVGKASIAALPMNVKPG